MADQQPTSSSSQRLRPHPHPERVYTGPPIDQLAPPRTRSQADKYFSRVANENILPTRYSKALGLGGWVFGGVAIFYMAIFADFGDREHVFSPVRRYFHSWTKDLVTLSPNERNIMGLDRPYKSDEAEKRPS